MDGEWSSVVTDTQEASRADSARDESVRAVFMERKEEDTVFMILFFFKKHPVQNGVFPDVRRGRVLVFTTTAKFERERSVQITLEAQFEAACCFRVGKDACCALHGVAVTLWQ